MCGDIKNFYLGTPMESYEYMRLPLAILPQEIMDAYDLINIAHNGHVYVEIRRGMYGLPKPASLQTNYSRNAFNPMDIISANTPPAYGATYGAQYSSHWSSTTLG
jgi:hypothetical protein